MVVEVPPTGGERESLRAALQRSRDALAWKAEGLDDEQLRRRMTPSGTSLLGLVKHLAYVEYGWFCGTFGREVEAYRFIDETDPESDLTVHPDESTDDVLAFAARARAAADAALDETDLETLGTAWFGKTVSMRWVLVHMLQETTRHAGHADVVRELIDGRTGDHARG